MMADPLPYLTPPMAPYNTKCLDDWGDDEIEAYLSKPYEPLSSLPTPPSSSHSMKTPRDFTSQVLIADVMDRAKLNPKFLGMLNFLPHNSASSRWVFVILDTTLPELVENDFYGLSISTALQVLHNLP
jgi:hypothetical protein